MLVWVTATEDKDLGSYRVSIRSRGPIINEVAANHGGGGHIYASGTRLKTEEEINSLLKDLVEVSKQYIEKTKNFLSEKKNKKNRKKKIKKKKQQKKTTKIKQKN